MLFIGRQSVEFGAIECGERLEPVECIAVRRYHPSDSEKRKAELHNKVPPQ